MKIDSFIKEENSLCKQCFSIKISLPCELDKNIIDYLFEFGEPIAGYSCVGLLMIETALGISVSGKFGKKELRVFCPEHLHKLDVFYYKKDIFYKCLSKWISNKLKFNIES